jgi:hypothetical protein
MTFSEMREKEQNFQRWLKRLTLQKNPSAGAVQCTYKKAQILAKKIKCDRNDVHLRVPLVTAQV